jgi:hypothetical protein
MFEVDFETRSLVSSRLPMIILKPLWPSAESTLNLKWPLKWITRRKVFGEETVEFCDGCVQNGD